MKRRELLTALGGAMVWPLAAHAQQPKQQPRKIPRVGMLWHAGSPEEEDVYLRVLTKAFNDLGYIEGKTIDLEHRFPAEQPERFRSFARELVESKVDAIIAVTALGAKEAKQASRTIPIVVVLEPDPVGDGLVESLARPGGNVTGLSLMGVDLSGKRLALMKEAVPNLSSVALLVDPGDPNTLRSIPSYVNAAKVLGLSLRAVEAPTPASIDQAFAAFGRDGFDGVVVGPGPMLFNERARIGASALAHKISTVVGNAEMVPFGPLLSYGPDLLDYFRRAAGYMDKILKGAKPADLPVEQPARFKMVVSAKTAKALGLNIPTSLLINADEVIE
jgi:putative ABC transport system substrate-binding protein